MVGMLQYASQINNTVKGLDAVVENRSPSIKLLMDNWPIALLAGVAITGRVMQRHKKKELSAYNLLIDMGAVMSPVVALMTLQRLGQERMRKQEEKKQQQQIQKTAIRPLQVTAPDAGAQLPPVTT